MKEYLAEACHNTFVIFDCLESVSLDSDMLKKAHKRLQQENRDDALLLVNGQVQGDVFSAQMVVLGMDGELGEYCGNGARACAAFLFKNYPHPKMYLRTNTSSHPITKLGVNQFSVALPPVRFEINPKFITNTLPSEYTYVEVIEPHLVIENKLTCDEHTSLARDLNAQKDLFPLGMNLNVFSLVDHETIAVTTYERGVQRLTQSCGTGSVACASVFQKRHPELTKVYVNTPGGKLTIFFKGKEIELCGEAIV